MNYINCTKCNFRKWKGETCRFCESKTSEIGRTIYEVKQLRIKEFYNEYTKQEDKEVVRLLSLGVPLEIMREKLGNDKYERAKVIKKRLQYFLKQNNLRSIASEVVS